MRQSGILAAAGLFALRHNVERLQEDHDNAQHLADGLNRIPGFELEEQPQTNILKLCMDEKRLEALRQFLSTHQVIIANERWVLHRDIAAADVDGVIELCTEFANHAERP